METIRDAVAWEEEKYASSAREVGKEDRLHKDVETLKKYTTERGKISSWRVTGTCAMPGDYIICY